MGHPRRDERGSTLQVLERVRWLLSLMLWSMTAAELAETSSMGQPAMIMAMLVPALALILMKNPSPRTLVPQMRVAVMGQLRLYPSLKTIQSLT